MNKVRLWVTSLLSLVLASCVVMPKVTVTAVPENATGEYPQHTLLTEAISRAASSGKVSASAIKTDKSLTEYLEQLAGARLESIHDRQSLLALWINAHNAYVLDVMRNNATNRGAQSIESFHGAQVAIVAKEKYSIAAIENEIIAKQFREPRAFFALYRASRSGPALAQEAFVAEKLSEQLDLATRRFLADSTRNRLDKPNRKLYLSSLFQQHQEHFERASGTLRSFVMAYAPTSVREYLDQHPLTEIAFLRYDWTTP
jgi:hypothetical protein